MLETRFLIEYFYQPNCEDCRKVSEFVLKPMNEKYASKVQLKKYNLSKGKEFSTTDFYTRHLT